MSPSNFTLQVQLSWLEPVTHPWQLLLFGQFEKSRQASFRGWLPASKKVKVVQYLSSSHNPAHSVIEEMPMMVWTRLPSWISHSSLSMKQSRRHWVRGVREKNSKVCSRSRHFWLEHVKAIHSTHSYLNGRKRKEDTIKQFILFLPLSFLSGLVVGLLHDPGKSWECGHFQRIWKGQSFVSPSKRRSERIGRQGLPANLSLISHFPAIPGILGLIFIKSMNCLNWKKECSQISHNVLSPPHHLSITDPSLQSLQTDRRKSTDYIHLITITAKD